MTSNFVSFRVFALVAGTFLVSPAVPGQSADTSLPAPKFSDEPLVISQGTLSHAGKTTPATVQNAVELLRQRYPDANITVLGVADVVLGDLTLNWKRRRARNDDGLPIWHEPPLDGVLRTLVVAAKYNFSVDGNDGRNFLLRAPEHDPTAALERTEVFNLTPLLPEEPDRSALQRELRKQERVLALATKRFGADHRETATLADRVALIKAELAEDTTPSPELVKERVDEIREVVALTLAAENNKAKPPEFRYHAGTRLLVATGNAAAIRATQQVLAAMR